MNLPEGTRAELIEGEIFTPPSPRLRHQVAVGNLFAFLREFVNRRGLGRVFVAPFDVHLPSGDVVEPDIQFVSNSSLHIIKDWVHGAPDLAVEVLSPEAHVRDRIVKRDLYARNGILEYWIVDPEAQTVEVFVLRGDQYQPEGYFERADVLVSPLLPEFRPRLPDIFAGE